MPNLITAAITLEDGIAHYLARLQKRGRAAHTLQAYGTDLAQFAAYVRDRADSSLVALQAQRQVAGWLDALSAADVSERSQARKLTVLRGFFKHAKAEGWTGHDPTAGESVAFRAKRVIAPEMEDLLRLVDSIPRETRNDIRDRAMLRLALDGAIRIGEVAALDVPGVGSQSTVDLQRKLVHLVGKGGDTQTVAINDRTAAMVEDWLRIRHFTAEAGALALFVSGRGGRMSRQALHAMFKLRASAAGIDPAVSWHHLRHRRIGMIFESLGVKVAQVHARHLNPSTTSDTYGHHAETRERSLIRRDADLDAARAHA
jgi:integrase/recombinase XerD